MDNYQIRRFGEAVVDSIIDSLDAYAIGSAVELLVEDHVESKLEEKLEEYVSGLSTFIDDITNALDNARELICSLEDMESAVDTLKGEMGLCSL